MADTPTAPAAPVSLPPLPPAWSDVLAAAQKAGADAPTIRAGFQKWSADTLNAVRASNAPTPIRQQVNTFIANQYDQFEQPSYWESIGQAVKSIPSSLGSLAITPGAAIHDAATEAGQAIAGTAGTDVGTPDEQGVIAPTAGRKTAVLAQQVATGYQPLLNRVGQVLAHGARIGDIVNAAGAPDYQAESQRVDQFFNSLDTRIDSGQPLSKAFLTQWGDLVKGSAAKANGESPATYNEPDRDPTNAENLKLIAAYAATKDPVYRNALKAKMTIPGVIKEANAEQENTPVGALPDWARSVVEGAGDPINLAATAATIFPLTAPEGAAAKLTLATLGKAVGEGALKGATVMAPLNVAQTAIQNPNATDAQLEQAGTSGLVAGALMGGVAHAAPVVFKGIKDARINAKLTEMGLTPEQFAQMDKNRQEQAATEAARQNAQAAYDAAQQQREDAYNATQTQQAEAEGMAPKLSSKAQASNAQAILNRRAAIGDVNAQVGATAPDPVAQRAAQIQDALDASYEHNSPFTPIYVDEAATEARMAKAFQPGPEYTPDAHTTTKLEALIPRAVQAGLMNLAENDYRTPLQLAIDSQHTMGTKDAAAAAQVLENHLAQEDRIRQSPQGSVLLRQQLQAQSEGLGPEATPPQPQAINIAAPSPEQAISEGKAATGGGKAGAAAGLNIAAPQPSSPINIAAVVNDPAVHVADIAAHPELDKIPVEQKANLQVAAALSPARMEGISQSSISEPQPTGEQPNATKTGKIPNDNPVQPEGTSPRPEVPAHESQVRPGNGESPSSGGGADPSAKGKVDAQVDKAISKRPPGKPRSTNYGRPGFVVNPVDLVLDAASEIYSRVRDAAAWTKEMAAKFTDLSKEAIAKIYGWVTKQTPEQVAESTAAHYTQKAGEALSSAWTNTLQKLKHGSTLPDWVQEIHQRSLRNAQASADEGHQFARSLNGYIGNDDTLREKVNRALQGDEGELNELPDKLKAVAQAARSAIDEKSFRINRQLGDLLTTALRDKLGTGIGEYLTRSYRMFDDPDAQLSSITPEQQGALIHDFMTQFGVGHEEAVHLYNQFIDRDNLGSTQRMVEGGGKFAGKDTTSFIRRKDLWNSMRTVLGEYTDPVERVQKTIEKQNNLLNNDAAQRAIREQGLATGQFRTTEKPGDVELKPSADSGMKYDRLRGLFTDRDFRKKFFESDPFSNAKDMNAIGRIIHTITSLTNQSLVGLNPKILIPQLDADTAANLMMGYVKPKGYVRGLGEATRSVGLGDRGFAADATKMERRQTLINEGILGKSAAEGVLTPDRQKGENLADYVPGYRKASELNSKIVGGASNAAKIARFENYEQPQYAKAFAVDIAKKHPDWTPAQVKAEALKQGTARAGEVMRGTSHYYETLPKAIKFTGKYIPGTNYFLNFPYNIYRTAVNGVLFAQEDLARGAATGNQEFTKIGLKRLAAMTAFLTATAAGVSVINSKVSPEKQAAFQRSFMPDYDKKESIAFQGDVDANHAKYSPLSYVNPYTLVTKGVVDALSQKTFGDKLKSIGDAIGAQLGGDNPVYQAGAQAITNRDKYGRPIAYPQDPNGGLKRTEYALGQLQPQFIPFFKDVYKGATGQTSPSGKKFSVGDSALSLTGIRTRDLNPTDEFTYKAKDALNQLNTIQQGYRTQVSHAPDEATKQQVFSNAQAASNNTYQTLFNLRDDLKTLGASDAVVATQLKNAGFSDESVGRIMQGKSSTPTLPRPKELLDAAKANDTILAVANDAVQKANESSSLHNIATKILANPTGDTARAAINDGIKNGTVPTVNGQPDPGFMKRLDTAYAAMVKAKNEDAQIKDIAKLGASSTDAARAKEIYRIITQDLHTPEDRAKFGQQLMAAKLLTPIVKQQLNLLAQREQQQPQAVGQ